MRRQRLDRADIEERAKREAHIGRVPHLQHRGGERQWQALSAMLGREGERVPAALDVVAIGFLEAGGGAHHAVLERAALLVADAVQRRQHAARELRRLLEDGVDRDPASPARSPTASRSRRCRRFPTAGSAYPRAGRRSRSRARLLRGAHSALWMCQASATRHPRCRPAGRPAASFARTKNTVHNLFEKYRG